MHPHLNIQIKEPYITYFAKKTMNCILNANLKLPTAYKNNSK